MPNRETLIIGCGYIGLPLARACASRGDQVYGWVHSPASAEALVSEPLTKVIIGSVGDSTLWEKLKHRFDLIIHCASSSRGGEEAYREVFQKGLQLMNRHQAQAHRLFVSSTSVYSQTNGEIVTEKSQAEPTTTTGKILRSAEEEARAQGTVIVRSAGIYGPGRGVLFAKLQRGEAVIEGDGSRWLNQIHQHDLVAALLHLTTHGIPGEIYNACDHEPVSLLDYYRWCAAFLQRPLPPSGPANLERKRGLSNKRVSNAKLRATGWEPIYPSFREGLTADHSPR